MWVAGIGAYMQGDRNPISQHLNGGTYGDRS